MVRRTALAALAATLLAPSAAPGQEPSPTSQLLHRDVLVGADLWDRRPRMLAAGLGFTSIVGVPGLTTTDLPASEALVRAAGGTWSTPDCAAGTTPALAAYTSASTPEMVAFSFGQPVERADGLPVELSWPVLPSTVGPTDFAVTLSTGEVVTPEAAAIYPNAELNERAVVVLFGRFGNRLDPGDPAAVHPVRTEVVADATPLRLVGPGARTRSAVGLAAEAPGSPYADGAGHGPRLVAAKLTRMSTRGERAPAPFAAALPNDGVALYGDAARWRLRVLTTGGFSPDGVRGVFPTDFERFFRLVARAPGGRRVVVDRAGRDVRVGDGTVRVLGLADLGRRQDAYDACYAEDKDNQIDIVLAGDRSAVRRITHVEIPARGAHDPFFNPGGPGTDPTPGVRYTSPGPAVRQPVLVALGDPLTVTLRRP